MTRLERVRALLAPRYTAQEDQDLRDAVSVLIPEPYATSQQQVALMALSKRLAVEARVVTHMSTGHRAADLLPLVKAAPQSAAKFEYFTALGMPEYACGPEVVA